MTADTVNHWAAALIGMPWVAGTADCWAFARSVWLERFGWDVPAVSIDAKDARATRHALSAEPVTRGWDPVLTPVEGDAVLMAKGARPCHVGIWICPDEAPGVLHAVEGAGVIYTVPGRLAGLGYHIVGFYRRRA